MAGNLLVGREGDRLELGVGDAPLEIAPGPDPDTFLLDDLFHRTSLERVEARCAVDNEASQRVLEKVGFAREGLLRSYFRLHGKRVDNHLYAMLKTDWLAE